MEWISDKINSRINTSVQGIALNTYGSEKFDPEAEGRSIVATLTEADRNKKIRDLLAFQVILFEKSQREIIRFTCIACAGSNRISFATKC